TDGMTMTHSALSSSSCGILSGMLRISFKTLPLFSTRSASLFPACAGRANSPPTSKNDSIFFIGSPFGAGNFMIRLLVAGRNEPGGVMRVRAGRLPEPANYFPVQKRALQNTPSVGGGIREVMIRPFSVFCVIGRIAFGPHVLA